MKFAKMSAESGRWDDVASRIARTEASLQELSEAEKEPIIAELSALRQAVEEAQRQAGLDLYTRLSTEATAAWPAIAEAIATETGFDPGDAGAWRGRTVRFEGVYNRIGWDYDGGYDVAITIDGIPVAGNYARAIADAVRDVQQRTHMGIDDHAPWDVIAVIQGSGSIGRRNVRELGYTKVESWDPMPCVVMRIIALHAGPIAMGPDRP